MPIIHRENPKFLEKISVPVRLCLPQILHEFLVSAVSASNYQPEVWHVLCVISTSKVSYDTLLVLRGSATED